MAAVHKLYSRLKKQKHQQTYERKQNIYNIHTYIQTDRDEREGGFLDKILKFQRFLHVMSFFGQISNSMIFPDSRESVASLNEI